MQTQSDLVSFLRFVVDQKGGSFVPIDDLARALDAGQHDLFNHYCDLEIGKQGSEPTVTASGYGASSASLDALRPFRTILAPNGLPTDGTVPIPVDCARLLGLFVNDGAPVLVREVLTGELSFILKSKIYPVTDTAPVCLAANGVMQCYPTTLTVTEIHYLRRPAKVLIKYTTPGNDEVVSDEVGVDNVPPEFSPAYWPELCARALVYLGVALSDAEVYTMAKQQEA